MSAHTGRCNWLLLSGRPAPPPELHAAHIGPAFHGPKGRLMRFTSTRAQVAKFSTAVDCSNLR